jgi:anti-anti-sigma regulatory factor
VVRFIQPDLRPVLDDFVTIDDCELFQELHAAVLADLAAGEGLVLNLGLVEVFTSPMLCFLLRVREIIRERRGWLVLCQLRPEHRAVFEITKTLPLFTTAPSEAQAVRMAREWRQRT